MLPTNRCFFSGASLREKSINSPHSTTKEHLISKHDLSGVVLTLDERSRNIVRCAKGLNSSMGMAPASAKLVFSAVFRHLGSNNHIHDAWNVYDVNARAYGQHWWSDKNMNMPDSVTPFWSIKNEHYGITKEILADRNSCMRWARRVNKVLIPVLLEFGAEAAKFEAVRRKYTLPMLDIGCRGV